MVSWPSFPLRVIPTLPTLQLSDDERATITRLQAQLNGLRPLMELNEAYYLGEQVMTTLGIAIPDELKGLRTVIGWPATAAVDPLAVRCNVLGFRLRGATDTDQDLQDQWDANNLDAEQALLTLDALSIGSGWYTIGAGDSNSDPAMIRVESPLNMSAEWDPRALRPRNVLQTYWAGDSWHMVLYKPDGNVYIDDDGDGQWVVSERQRHNVGRPLAVRAVNRPRTRARDGASEITAAIRSLTDSACRALLNLTVAGEIYSVPRRYILGATESDFQNTDGTAKSGWDAYITTMLGLERDENGELPTVGQFQAYDPATFTKVLDFYAAQMAGMTGAVPQELGLYTEGNPPSADSVEFAESRRNRNARRKHAQLGVAHVEALQLGMMVQNGGKLPGNMRHISVEWEDPAQLSFSAAADGLQKLISVGSIPARSDVTLGKAGFTPVERARLAQDRDNDQGEQELAALAGRLRGSGDATPGAVAG